MAMKCALLGHCGTSCVKWKHHIKYCSVIVCLFVWVNSDTFLHRKESHEMCQISVERTELLLTGLRRGNVFVCYIAQIVTNLY